MRTANRWLGVILLFLLSLAAFGQTNTGEVAGVVHDPSGAVVPNATITAKNVGTGFNRSVTSSSTGQYQMSALPVGRYEVSVNQSGFQPYKADLQVTVGSHNALDIALQVSGASTVVVASEHCSNRGSTDTQPQSIRPGRSGCQRSAG